MRKAFLLGVFLLLFTAVAGLVHAQEMDLETALGFFDEDDNVMLPYSDEGKATLEEMIDAFKTALGVPGGLNELSEDDVGAFEVSVELKHVMNKLSQAYYTLANVFLSEPEDEEIYIKGKNWGFGSLRKNDGFDDLRGGRFDDSVARETDYQALYWANSCWLREAEKDVKKAVLGGIPKKSRMINDRLVEIAPTYMAGGVYRAYGAFWSGLPGDIFTRTLIGMGQDLDLALFYLCHLVDQPDICADCDVEERIEGAREYFENRTFFAEFYLMAKKMWSEAAAVLQSVIDDPIGDKYPLMNAYAQENARQLLEEVNENL